MTPTVYGFVDVLQSTPTPLMRHYFCAIPHTRKVLILAKKENLSREGYWHNFFGYDNPFVEYAEYFYEDEGKCKNENPRLMAWVEENMDKGIEKIVIIDDYSDQKALDPKNGMFVETLFCTVPEFNFTTFLITHKFNDSPVKLRNNSAGFITLPALSDSDNRKRSGGSATKIMDGKLSLYELFIRNFMMRHNKCAYVSMDLRRIEGGGNLPIDEKVKIEKMVWWYVAESTYNPPEIKEQKRWFGYVKGGETACWDQYGDDNFEEGGGSSQSISNYSMGSLSTGGKLAKGLNCMELEDIGDRVDTEVNTAAWEEASISTLGTNFSL